MGRRGLVKARGCNLFEKISVGSEIIILISIENLIEQYDFDARNEKLCEHPESGDDTDCEDNVVNGVVKKDSSLICLMLNKTTRYYRDGSSEL